jgi:prepilin-type N-terminal cleavage/methylation domain-containing protein
MFLFLVPHVIYTDEDVDATTERVRERAPRLEKALPDSIPLFWEERGDTLVAPAVHPAPPQPPAQPPAPRDEPAPAGSAPAPARRSPRRRGRRRMAGNREGFTLPELLTVIVVLGIAAAAAIPALRPPAERSAGAAADALRRLYADARGDAAGRGVPVVVELETAGGTFVVRTAPEEGDADTLRRGALPLPPEARLLGGRGGLARAAFDATGRARADLVTVVHGEVRHAVRVDPWTGAARTAP